MPINPDDAKTRLPQPLALLVLLISGIVVLSALAGGVASMLTSPPTWFLLGFEVVTLIAAAMGVLLGLGKFPSGPGLALLCVAGAIGASAFLGYLSASKELMGVKLMPFLLARAAAAAGLGAIAGLAVLGRRPKASVPKLIAGVVCAVALVATGAGAWVASGRMASMGEIVQAVAGVLIFVVLLGLLAASVHLFIAAFETCDVDQLPERERA